MDIDLDHNTVPDAGAVEDSEDEYDDVLDYADTTRSGRKRPRMAATDEPDTNDDSSLPVNLHMNDIANFLKLATALKLLLSHEITEEDLDLASNLLRVYCLELIEVCRQIFCFHTIFLDSQALAVRSSSHQAQPSLCNACPSMHT